MRKIGQILRFLIPVIAVVSLLVFMTGAGKQRMTKKAFVDAYSQWDQAWNAGNVDPRERAYFFLRMDATMAPNCVTHVPPSPDIVGLEAYKKYITDSQSAFPDLRLTHQQYILDGNWGASLFTWTGTHKDTGKRVKVTGACITKWVDGKCVEHWTFADNLGLMQQLGFKLVPAEQPKK